MLVLTDFSRVFPITITADKPIDYALQKMKNSGIRLLIVVNKKHHMTGLISADKIMGDDPVRLAGDSQLDHSQITVSMLMKPQKDIHTGRRNEPSARRQGGAYCRNPAST